MKPAGLEQVIHCNLTRLSRLLRILRFHAQETAQPFVEGRIMPFAPCGVGVNYPSALR